MYLLEAAVTSCCNYSEAFPTRINSSHLIEVEEMWLHIKFLVGEYVFHYANLAQKEANSKLAKNEHIAVTLQQLEQYNKMNFNMRDFGIALSGRKFYENLFKREDIAPHRWLLFLCIAANLYSCVAYMIDGTKITPLALAVAALGPKIVPGEEDRLQMMKLLVNNNPNVINSEVQLPFFSPPLIQQNQRRTCLLSVLGLLLASKRVYDLDKEHRITIAEFLLRKDANPDIILPNSSIHNDDSISALQHCVLYESAAMVRLFLQYYAHPSYPGTLTHPYTLALRRMDTEILRALREAGWSCTPKVDGSDYVPNAIYSYLSTLAGFPAILELGKLREAQRIGDESYISSVYI